MEGAYTAEHFQVDWEDRCAVCPQGRTSVAWRTGQRQNGDLYVVARFDPADCSTCTARALCTRSAKQPRQLFLKPQAQHEALQARREQMHSEAVPGAGRRRGDPLTGSPHQQPAAAVNVARLGAWWEGPPHAATRVSHFARLAA
jgi:transposase